MQIIIHCNYLSFSPFFPMHVVVNYAFNLSLCMSNETWFYRSNCFSSYQNMWPSNSNGKPVLHIGNSLNYWDWSLFTMDIAKGVFVNRQARRVLFLWSRFQMQKKWHLSLQIANQFSNRFIIKCVKKRHKCFFLMYKVDDI